MGSSTGVSNSSLKMDFSDSTTEFHPLDYTITCRKRHERIFFLLSIPEAKVDEERCTTLCCPGLDAEGQGTKVFSKNKPTPFSFCEVGLKQLSRKHYPTAPNVFHTKPVSKLPVVNYVLGWPVTFYCIRLSL